MVNINKLRGKIVEKELTIERLAERIGVDRSTLYRRIDNNGDGFTIKEVDLICRVLELTGREANEIFFSQYVA